MTVNLVKKPGSQIKYKHACRGHSKPTLISIAVTSIHHLIIVVVGVYYLSNRGVRTILVCKKAVSISHLQRNSVEKQHAFLREDCIHYALSLFCTVTKDKTCIKYNNSLSTQSLKSIRKKLKANKKLTLIRCLEFSVAVWSKTYDVVGRGIIPSLMITNPLYNLGKIVFQSQKMITMSFQNKIYFVSFLSIIPFNIFENKLNKQFYK